MISFEDLRHDGAEWVTQAEVDALADVVEAARDLSAYGAGEGRLLALDKALSVFEFGGARAAQEGATGGCGCPNDARGVVHIPGCSGVVQIVTKRAAQEDGG